ncbi:50S ribosomal protein L25/general stress protein Ctc [Gordonia sp. CPCC 205333]|uniref:50S ribosomal protein L25/general stress protein Ctc n=1 Tax=Gordonia sp. CPCC 205333 TaxID=3140790 RepID=UPI003AF4011D
MATAPQLAVTTRTETGKGAARRARRAGNVPAVLYGHGTTPEHLYLPNNDFAAILRNSGTNVVIELSIEGRSQLALTKQIDIHPIRNFIQHADLLIVKRGEKITIEIPVVIEGESLSGTLVTQDASYIEIEADALSIPEQITVSVEGAGAGTSIHASELTLPEGVSLVADPETLIVAVNEAQAADEGDTDEEAASDEAATEGDAAE